MGILDDSEYNYDYAPAAEDSGTVSDWIWQQSQSDYDPGNYGTVDDWNWQQSQGDYVPPMSFEDFLSQLTPEMLGYGGYQGLGIGNPGSYGGETVLPEPAITPDMLGYGGYQDLGIGNPGSYGGETVLPDNSAEESSMPLDFTSFLSGLGRLVGVSSSPAQTRQSSVPMSYASFLSGLSGGGGQSEGQSDWLSAFEGSIPALISAGLGAYSANKQNQITKSAQAAYNDKLAEAKKAASAYNAPLRLVNPRTATDPVARQGASTWFKDNKLPSYYARGGGVGALRQTQMNYVRGGSPGQADDVPSRLSHGEYVMDSDVVSALGDGNNEAGAAKLDQMRENIRQHKRSAPKQSIPPKAKSTQAYLKGAK